MGKIGAGLSSLAALTAGAAGAVTYGSNIEAIIDNPLTNYSMALDERIEHVLRSEECMDDLESTDKGTVATGSCAVVLPLAIQDWNEEDSLQNSKTAYLDFDAETDTFRVHIGKNANLDLEQAQNIASNHLKETKRDVSEQQAGAIAGNAFLAGAFTLGAVWLFTAGKN